MDAVAQPISLNLDFLELAPGNQNVMQALLPDIGKRQALLSGSADQLKGFADASSLTENNRNGLVQWAQGSLLPLPFGEMENLKKNLDISKLQGTNAKQIAAFSGMIVKPEEDMKGVKKITQGLRLIFQNQLLVALTQGNTMTLDVEMGNVSNGAPNTKVGNIKNAMHPRNDMGDTFQLPGDEPPTVNGAAANLPNLRLFCVRTKAYQRLLSEAAVAIHSQIEILVNNNQHLSKYWEEAKAIAEAFSAENLNNLTPMARLLCQKVNNVHLYLHVIFIKLLIHKMQPQKDQRLTHLDHVKKRLSDFMINKGILGNKNSVATLGKALNAVREHEQSRAEHGDEHPQRHTEEIIISWYSTLQKYLNTSVWSRHLMVMFYTVGTCTRNPDTSEIIRKLNDMVAEQKLSDESHLTFIEEHAAAAYSTQPSGQTKAKSKSKPKKDAKSKAPSKPEKAKKSTSAPKCTGPCHNNSLLECIQLRDNKRYHPQDDVLRGKIRAADSQEFRSQVKTLPKTFTWFKKFVSDTTKDAKVDAAVVEDIAGDNIVPISNTPAFSASLYDVEANIAYGDFETDDNSGDDNSGDLLSNDSESISSEYDRFQGMRAANDFIPPDSISLRDLVTIGCQTDDGSLEQPLVLDAVAHLSGDGMLTFGGKKYIPVKKKSLGKHHDGTRKKGKM